MNDDLVAKKFGVYDSQLAAGRELDELEQELVMLPPSVLRQTSTTARTLSPGKHTRSRLLPVCSDRIWIRIWIRTLLLLMLLVANVVSSTQPRLQPRLRVEPV